MEKVWTNFLNTSEKDYYLEDGRIITTEKSFGDVITRVVFQSEDKDSVRRLWNHMVFLFSSGKKEKLNDIKRVLEIR